MATAAPSAYINSLRGRLGSVVFYKRYGTQCARTWIIPRNPNTESQRKIRRLFAEAVRAWQAMDPEQQYSFIRKARHTNMSGYNLFISNYMKTKSIITGAENTAPVLIQNTAKALSSRPTRSVSTTNIKAYSPDTDKNNKNHPPG